MLICVVEGSGNMKYDIIKYPLGSLVRAIEQLKNKDLSKALKTMKDGNIPIAKVKTEFDMCIEWLYLHKAFGVILSAYYRYGNCSSYTVTDLLKRMYEVKDYPSFLKQAYRFDAYKYFTDEVETSIGWHENRNLPDAKAWRYKFTKLAESLLLQKNDINTNEEIVILEELTEKEARKKDAQFLKLRPIQRSNINKNIVLEKEANNDPYIISRIAKTKIENANIKHKNTVLALIQYLKRKKYAPIESKLIDTFCFLNSGPAIFEIKSITEDNEREQIRHAISQLYEYRFLHMLPEASLWIVFSEKPFSQWFIDYLISDRNINVIWAENDSFNGPSINGIA